MKKHSLRAALTHRCVWRIAFPVLTVLAAAFYLLALWSSVRAPGSSSPLTRSEVGAYARLSVSDVSDPFAEGAGETFYFLADEQGYLYLAVLSDEQYAALRTALETADAELHGVALRTPDDVRRIACSCFPGVSAASFEDYFGPLYLDCVRAPFGAQQLLFSGCALCCVLAAMGAFCLWLRRATTVRACLQRLSSRGMIKTAERELFSAGDDERCGTLTVTEHLLCDTRRGLIYDRADLSALRVKRGRLHIRLRGRVFSGDIRTLARVPAAQGDDLRMLFTGPVRLPRQYPGLFVEPSYWNMEGVR